MLVTWLNPLGKIFLFGVLLLQNSFQGYAQGNYTAKIDHLIVNKPDLKGEKEIGMGIISNEELALIVYYTENSLVYKTISNTKEISRDLVLKDNIDKYGKYVGIYHNYLNDFTYLSLINETEKGKKLTYYLRKVDLFNHSFEGPPIKIGEFKFLNKYERNAFNPKITFDDDGNLLMKNISLNFNKSGEYYIFDEDLEPIEEDDDDNVILRNYPNAETTKYFVKATFYHKDLSYQIVKITKDGSVRYKTSSYFALMCFDEDGELIYEKDLKINKKEEMLIDDEFRFYSHKGSVYFAGTFRKLVTKPPSQHPSDPTFICYGKFNLESDEVDYIKTQEFYSILKESDKLFFNRSAKSSSYIYYDLAPPKLTFGEDGFIFSTMCHTNWFTDIYNQKSDLHLKIDEDGNIVKYLVIKKNIEARSGAYRFSFPFYISQNDGSLIGFYLANPEDPLNESFKKLIPKEGVINKASTHFIHISPDLNLSTPVNIQKSIKENTFAPYFVPQKTFFLRSPEERNTKIYLTYNVTYNVISIGFLTVEKD